MPLAGALTTYRAEVARYNGHVARAHLKDAAGLFYLSSDERSFVVESAFLRLFVAWEKFLESAFVAYMLGNPSSSGKLPGRYVSPLDDDHAHRMLIGTQKYVDWSNPEIIRKLAELYFVNGDPINSVISTINSDLFDLKTIRNSCAHISTTTVSSLNGLASRKLGSQQVGTTVMNFILTLDPSQNPPKTFFDSYLELLDIAASSIANWS